MFSHEEEFVSESDKIDYIYKTLKRQAKFRAFMISLKLAIIAALFYSYFFILPKKNFDSILEKYIAPQVSKLVEMTMKSVNPANINIQTPALETWKWNIKITPEMIEQFKKLPK